MKKFLLDDADYRKIYKENTKNAGSKARRDIEFFLQNYQPVYCTVTRRNKLKNMLHFFGVARKLKGNEVVVQYPLYVGEFYQKCLDHCKAGKKTALIHDLECLRLYADQPGFIEKEIQRLNGYDQVISHNIFMSHWLRENGCKVPIKELELFDYQTSEASESLKRTYENRYQIAFAGNLKKEKSAFLYDPRNLKMEKIKFNLYGIGYKEEDIHGTIYDYKGAYEPAELPNLLEGGFGLIWDGSTAKTCSGVTGEYLRYNNPHKLSLYIAASLPVIIWQEAAQAKCVEKYKIGITVSSLEEVEKILNEMNRKEYEDLCTNVKKLAKKVQRGGFTRKAVEG